MSSAALSANQKVPRQCDSRKRANRLRTHGGHLFLSKKKPFDAPWHTNLGQAREAEIESEEEQPLVLVQPPTLPCTLATPYQGVEVRERSQIFYTADTFVLDDPDATDSFVLEVPNEFLNLKKGVHASLPKYVHAPFVIDISKGDGIT
ncbi:hypothetical protein Scep_004723 [Stephania cephalantha]|uniref:Uncharacterized protein n=1 Tax=Stephania cephalantha TaxID=152367 RepID=A0AAP0KUM1_9MAGN